MNRKWLSWVFGREYVFFWFMGFCVVMMRKGNFILYFVLLNVIWCFFIILNRVDCVLVGVWLILLMSMMFEKIGFFLKLKVIFFILNIEVLSIFVGMRLGVNCICEKLMLSICVRVLDDKVFVILGIFLRRMCLFVKMLVMSSFIILVWLIIYLCNFLCILVILLVI